MAIYPNDIFAPRTRNNKEGVVYKPSDQETFFVEDINKGDDEIVAIQNELGKNPSGDFDNVKKRLEAIEGVGINRFKMQLPITDDDLIIKSADAFYKYALGVNMRTSDVLNNEAYSFIKNKEFLRCEFDKNPELSVDIKLIKTYKQESYFGIGKNGIMGSGPFVGFFIDGGSTYCKVWDRYGNNVDSAYISGFNVANWNKFTVKYEAGVGAKFYVNKVLKVTIYNTYPDGENGSPFHIKTKTKSSGWLREIYYSPAIFSQDV